ncbi:hypothetical protein [Desulfosporosinus sp. SB140]|uniref:hypothetical protein n=1 Tax=Desulfosporosinus paludis TaxID=3115649 RepID=UPI003890B829
MGKGTKLAGHIAGTIVLKPILDQMKKERALEIKRENSLWNQASIDVMAERVEEKKPKLFEVHQPFDSIIHRSIW